MIDPNYVYYFRKNFKVSWLKLHKINGEVSLLEATLYC